MAQKSQKQKSPKSEAIYLFQHRNDLLFFTYDSGHSKRIDIDQFHIGRFRLFREDKVYSADLRSKPFLNPSLIWNAETFELMLKKLSEFVIQEQNIDFSDWLFVSVYIKVKGRQINLIKIRLTEQFGIQPQNQIWNEFKKYNNFKAKYLSQTFKTIETLDQQIEIVINRLQKTQQQQKQKVDEVKKKLSALMYQKQKKIMELTGNHLYKWTPQEQKDEQRRKGSNNLSVEPSQANFMSSQEDHMLVGSLFAPSQDYLI